MQTFIQNLSTVLEILNWIGGILIAIFAFIGLQQLKITKDTIAISSKRDAFKLTASQVTIFLERIIPLVNALDEKIKKKNITFFSESKIQIDGKNVSVDYPKSDKHLNELVGLVKELGILLNSLEAFSIYFVSGVASEELAFSSIGATYCDNVRSILPALMLLCEDGKYYQNIMQLFILWNSRIDKMDLLIDKENIESKLKHLSDKKIRPIGTEQ